MSLSRARLFFFAAALLLSHSPAIGKQPVDRPNVIFILADDLGYGELGCYGNGFNETPNLDRLARQGMRFTHSYAAAPVCSPYRASLLTGLHPARVGITDYLRPNSANALSTRHDTIAEVLRRDGFATGMIGKWHLTGYKYHDAQHEVTPADHGFDTDFAREVKGVGNGANFWPYVFRDQPIRWIDIPDNRLGPDEFLVDRMNAEAVDFIRDHQDEPFFLYLSHYAPHTIVHGKPALVEKYRSKHKPGKSSRTRCYLCQDQGLEGDSNHHWASDHNPHLAAMLESIDDGVGMITKTLDDLGLAERTIVVFTSDNGGETNVTSNAPCRGGKSQLYEGGIRVPLIVKWPAKIPAGAESEQPTVSTDFFPTLVDALEIETSALPADGVSMLETWQDPNAVPDRDTLFWHYPLDRPHFLGGTSSGAIRQGDWKLIEFFDTGKAELYSLADDPSEAVDVSDSQPELVNRLRQELSDWRRATGATVPSPPLLTRAGGLMFADHFSEGQVSDRWFFSKDWSAENGHLLRTKTDSDTTRIFLRDSAFRDAVVRFDFCFHDSEELRLVTGASGPYNAVIHLHRDHFFVQTAKDKSGPYFSYRHGECAYAFERDRWYTMTVEFLGEELVAHVDRDHAVYAKHPILDRERTYFAFQVDSGSASIDDVQILKASRDSKHAEQLQRLLEIQGRHPLKKSLEEQFAIVKTNAHEWNYQRDEHYRDLVKRVGELDVRNESRYPGVFRSHKQVQQAISMERKRLLAEDPDYKSALHATHRAGREIERYLISVEPQLADLPGHRRKKETERARARHVHDAEYQRLVAARDETERDLQQAYPELFVDNASITLARTKRREELKGDVGFREAVAERASAYRAQQDYLFEKTPELSELKAKIAAGNDP